MNAYTIKTQGWPLSLHACAEIGFSLSYLGGRLCLYMGHVVGPPELSDCVFLESSQPASYVYVAGGIKLMRTAEPRIFDDTRKPSSVVLARAQSGLKPDARDTRALVYVVFEADRLRGLPSYSKRFPNIPGVLAETCTSIVDRELQQDGIKDTYHVLAILKPGETLPILYHGERWLVVHTRHDSRSELEIVTEWSYQQRLREQVEKPRPV